MLKINILEIKEPDGSIHYNGAFSKRATDRYSFDTKEWTKNKNPICWHGGLFEHKNNVLTGRYFNTCLLKVFVLKMLLLNLKKKHMKK